MAPSKKLSDKNIEWDHPVQFLKGVGPKLSEQLQKAEIENLWDLLFHLPKAYEDRRSFMSYEDLLLKLRESETVITKVRFERTFERKAGRKTWIEAHVQVLNPKTLVYEGQLKFLWFQKWGRSLLKAYPTGTIAVCAGKLQSFRSSLQIAHPQLTKTTDQFEKWSFGSFIPVYVESAYITNRVYRKIIYQALERDDFLELPDALPVSIRKSLKLPNFTQSLKEVHFPKQWLPDSEDSWKENPFFKRLVFEELFLLSLAMYVRKEKWKKSFEGKVKDISVIPLSEKFSKEIEKRLPFNFTPDQEQVIREVAQDLSLNNTIKIPMHRLLLGDVGSGKTIVAFVAALACLKKGKQAALMAPTEILANQHYENFQILFPELKERVVLLKGALKEKEKKELREKIKEGSVQFIIGTQALISDSTEFHSLALVIVDEQHRFGVEQRITLKKNNEKIYPHLLVMTATPIPRSLALTLYGDLSLSYMKSKPKGRQSIDTFLINANKRDAMKERVKNFVEEGRQIYIVYPLVEESEELPLKNVLSAYEEWKELLGDDQVILLHGRMKPKEKDQNMEAFRSGKYKVLVSTTVIEVGVDVPNASVMIIENPERFGLAQLHQLRGRVGRGSQKSICVLVGSQWMSPLAKERLQVIVDNQDGFKISEKDLEIRGPGEFLGRRQSGLPGFRAAHVLRDSALLETAREYAKKIFEEDPNLLKEDHQGLKQAFQRWWAKKLEFTLSG